MAELTHADHRAVDTLWRQFHFRQFSEGQAAGALLVSPVNVRALVDRLVMVDGILAVPPMGDNVRHADGRPFVTWRLNPLTLDAASGRLHIARKLVDDAETAERLARAAGEIRNLKAATFWRGVIDRINADQRAVAQRTWRP